MKKQDLRTGQTVEFRNGERAKVLLNTRKGDILGGNFEEDIESAWMELNKIDDNLCHCSNNDYDILIIYDIDCNRNAASILEVGEKIWKRIEKPAIILDGVWYTENDLRRIIEKANQ